MRSVMRILWRALVVGVILGFLLTLVVAADSQSAYALPDPTLDKQVEASSDDCDVYGAGPTIDLLQNFYLAFADPDYQCDGARWTKVRIPQGSIITAAYCTFKALSDNSGDTTCRISGQDADDTDSFSTADDFTSRPRTDAFVDWAIPDFVAGTEYNTPSLVAIIQEIINRPNWAKCNSLVLFFEDITRANERVAYSYDDSSGYAPKLHIEYIGALGPYLYAGLDASPGQVSKIDLATFTEVGSVPVDDVALALARSGNYLYAGQWTAPAKIAEICLDPFAIESVLTLDPDEDECRALLRDNNFLYAGLSPGSSYDLAAVAKIDLATFSKVNTLVYNYTWALGCRALVKSGDYLYGALFGSSYGGGVGKICKINLAGFSKVSELTLTYRSVNALAISGNYLYAGHHLPYEDYLSPFVAVITKVNLTTFAEGAILLLDAGEYRILDMVVDGNYLYAGLDTSPAKIAKVDLTTFTKVATLTLGAGENSCEALAIVDGYLYAGVLGTGGVSEIDLATFTEVDFVSIPDGVDSLLAAVAESNGCPTNLLAVPVSSSQISLTWAQDTTYTTTGIFYKTSGYPTSPADAGAIKIYQGTAEQFTHQGLNPGTTYYYRVWSWTGTGWYTGCYASDFATTLLGKAPGLDVPVVPPEWWQTPQCTAYENLPIWDGIENLANAYEIPPNNFCVFVTLMGIITLSLGSWFITRTSLIILVMAFVLIIVTSIAGLLPMWMLVFDVVLGGLLIYIWLRG